MPLLGHSPQHYAAIGMNLFFFMGDDEGWDTTRGVSANFDPIERDWEEWAFPYVQRQVVDCEANSVLL